MSKLKCPHCGAGLETELTVVELPQTSITVRRSAKGRFGLTKREGQIVDLVVDGFNNGEIAKQLSMSEQTAKNFLSRAFLKIGCSNRAEMVSMVLLGTDQPR